MIAYADYSSLVFFTLNRKSHQTGQQKGFTYVSLFISLFLRAKSLSANDGMWHHLCVCWNNTKGVWKFYKDGNQILQGLGLKTGHKIQPNGSFILAQEQDSLGGHFDKHQSFQGTLTNVNMWDHVLPPEKIYHLSQSCLSGRGTCISGLISNMVLKANPGLLFHHLVSSTD